MHTFLGDLLNERSVVVDLGANHGEFATQVIDTFGCAVVAVEPVPYLFVNLPEREQLKVINACISSEDKPVQLNLSPHTCASIYEHDKIEQNEKVEVQGLTLNSLLQQVEVENVDLIKIDIEGAELDIFEYLSEDFLCRFKQITIEFHDFMWPEMSERVEKVKHRVANAGFYVIPFSLNNGDVLFVRKEHLSYAHYLTLKYPIKYLRGFRRLLKRR